MFSKNLKYYRLKKNMTKKELAKACQVTPMAISHYENGDRMPDMAIIKKLAEALDIHVVDFLTSRNTSLEFHHGEFRKTSTLTKGQQDFVREAVEEYFSRFFDAVECLGGNPLPDPIECHSLTISGNYEKDALILRTYLGFSNTGPIEDLYAALENQGILIFELNIDNSKFSGMNGTVNGYPYIVINANMNPERARTTIVHELAHLMFDWSSRNDEKANEKYATAIAGAFLITKTDLIRELGLSRSTATKDMVLTCEEYGISIYLLVVRAQQVGIMSEYAMTTFIVTANKAGYRAREPRRVRNVEHPTLFRQLVYRAVNEQDISVQRGAELLQVPRSEVEQYCGPMEVDSGNNQQ